VDQQTQQTLAADDARLRQIITENADGIIVVDAEGFVRFLNPAAEQLLARPAASLIGQQFGFPAIAGERAEIDLLRPDGAEQIAEMRVVATEWDGAPAHLLSLRDITEHRRAQQALRTAEAFNWAILNSLTVHLAVLDEHGTIIAVNDAWRSFAIANGDPDGQTTGVGVNYFAVCGRAAGPASDEAPSVIWGMRAVLDGALPAYELEYPCHSPSVERWFVLRAVPLRGAQRGLVVSHAEVTEQRRMAREAAEAEELRRRINAMRQELDDVDRIPHGDPAAARRPGPAPLRQRAPDTFQAAVRQYGLLLDRAVAERGFSGGAPSPALRTLGERLGAAGAAPRDVVEVHLTGVRSLSRDATVQRQHAYLEEGRLMALELMGYLAAHYRSAALGAEERP
jgi:PAS domain-containing protein